MAKNLEPYSVLMCLYKGDKPEYFSAALDSVLNQTVTPNDVVIVIDGAIPDKLEQVIKSYKKSHKKLNIVRLAKNVGVGAASNEGLKHCKHELVAKMDADDICAPDRFEKQLREFKRRRDLVLLGGQLAEFANDDPKNIVSYRRVPTTKETIKKFAKRRSPFNNVTVMYKKPVILAAGGYPKLNRAEDYYLYSKLMADGQIVDNLSDVLVYCRLDNDFIKRRKSWQHTKEMIGARNEIRKLGVSSWADLVVVSAAQIGLFLVPVGIAKKFYRKVRK